MIKSISHREASSLRTFSTGATPIHQPTQSHQKATLTPSVCHPQYSTSQPWTETMPDRHRPSLDAARLIPCSHIVLTCRSTQRGLTKKLVYLFSLRRITTSAWGLCYSHNHPADPGSKDLSHTSPSTQFHTFQSPIRFLFPSQKPG